MKHFKVFESLTQILVASCDKNKSEYHVLRLIKYNDLEAITKSLEDIVIEEVQSFTKLEYQAYMQKFKEPRASKSTRNTVSGSINAGLYQNFTEIIENGHGILGFVKFLKGYYLLIITQKKKIAKIGFHSIYTVKDMKMIPLYKWVSKLR